MFSGISISLRLWDFFLFHSREFLPSQSHNKYMISDKCTHISKIGPHSKIYSIFLGQKLLASILTYCPVFCQNELAKFYYSLRV